ncbi:MAG: manganese-binding transcriptional regulator MntR [Pirellulaceae bacterium]
MARSDETSERHTRTRDDHARETAEDYVEAIAEIIASQGNCRVSDLSKRFGVSHVTVSRIIGRLQAEGLLNTRPYYPIELTSEGEQLARESQERHKIVFDFLLALGLDVKTATIDSEGIEHHVSKKTLAAMKNFARTS